MMTKPTCPHCKHEFNDEQIWHGGQKCEFPTERDGDDGDFDCPGCGKELHVTLSMTPSWTFFDENGIDINPR